MAAQDRGQWLGNATTAPGFRPLVRDAMRAVASGLHAHAPVLTSGSHILPHHGVTNTRVVTHLALVVPDDCALVVGGEPHTWQEGPVSPSTTLSSTRRTNRSADTRVVMLLDAWNPYLSEVERAAIAKLIGGIGDFNRDAGGV